MYLLLFECQEQPDQGKINDKWTDCSFFMHSCDLCTKLHRESFRYSLFQNRITS